MEMTKELREKFIDVLYERCANGEISRDQRELLIEKVNSMFVATESETTTVDTDNVTESREFSSKEKYNMFRESVYAKCANGDITVEQREALLEKARDSFLQIEE